MSSLFRSVKKRKKSRVLGEVEVMSREEYTGLECGLEGRDDPGVGPVGVDARRRVARRGSEGVGRVSDTREKRRGFEAGVTGAILGPWGSAGQRVPVRVPRVRSVAERGEIPLRTYDELSPGGAVNELLLQTCALWDLLPELRVGGGGDSRSHRIVEFDGVSRFRAGEWGETAGDAGAGSVRPRT